MKNLASPEINELQGTIEFKKNLISPGKMPPHNYWHTSGKGAIHASKFSTWKITVMVEPRKIYRSETIGGRYEITTTRSICITDQAHRTNARGYIIHGIHRCIGVSL